MKKIEYVASGTSHMRILYSGVCNCPEVIDLINDYFADLNGKNNHQFSLLFNAFTEKDFGKKFVDFYKKSIYTIHADSGGLQIVTQGKTITSELKDQVYKIQSLHSDIGMCFDEIPINIVGQSSDRNNTSGRIFDRENFERYARLTGQNIKRQIEIFLEEKSFSKPMIIAQGNCYETYMSWVDFIMKEIPSSYYKNIGGIAMAAAALGTGTLEDIERAAYATKLPFQMDEPYIHILGVGSIRRLLPYIALAKSGYYPKNMHLSYDSSTHTSGLSMGSYHFNGKITSITRTFNKDYYTLYEDINSKYDLCSKGIDVHKFYNIINSNNEYFYNVNKENVDKERMISYYNALIGYVCSSISNFTHTIDSCLKSKDSLITVAHKNKLTCEINSLLNMRTIDDFKYWYNTYGSYTKSNRIKDSIATLDTFF